MAVIANVLNDVPKETFDYLLYPEQNPINQQYILNQLDQYKTVLRDTGKQYFDQARQLYDRINDSSIAKKAKAALRLATGSVKPNIIIELQSLEELRSASAIMQRYIMAEPTLRELYNNQRAQGYPDLYYDESPGDNYRNHRDYCKVMSGIVEDTQDDGWKVTTYAYEEIEGDTELTFDNKVDIIRTWDLVRMAINANEDPSSIEGEKL